MDTNKNNKEVVKTKQNPLINKTKQQLVSIIKKKDAQELNLHNYVNQLKNNIEEKQNTIENYKDIIAKKNKEQQQKKEQIYINFKADIKRLEELNNLYQNTINECTKLLNKRTTILEISIATNILLFIILMCSIFVF